MAAKEGKSFRHFTLTYIDANTVKPILTELAKEAKLSIDPFTNSVFAIDSIENLNNLERVIHSVDVPPKQVEVESAIIEIITSKGSKIGANIKLPGVSITDTISATAGTRKISPLDPADINGQGLLVGLTWNSVSSILAALEQSSKLTVMARPRIIALNAFSSIAHNSR